MNIGRVKIWNGYGVGDGGIVLGKSGGAMKMDEKGMVSVMLEGRSVKVYVAYLVARMFVPNPEIRPYVRHKNGVYEDNRAANLEWSEVREIRNKGKKKVRIRVRQYDAEGRLVRTYEDVDTVCQKFNVPYMDVMRAINSENGKMKGYIWRRA